MKTKPIFSGETLELTSSPNTMLSNFIRTLIDNYRNNQLKAINSSTGSTDAHSIHFDLTTLKKFISDIETETQKNNQNVTDQDLGIRFYYAAYPKADNWNIMANTLIGKEYAGKHTLVMVPTIKMKDEQGKMLSYDFNPLNSSHSNGEILAMTSARDSGLEENVVSQNHGSLIPPDSTKTESF